jgi:phage-related protein
VAKPAVAQAYVQIVPTTDGITSGLNKEFGPAGAEAGNTFGGTFNSTLKAAVVIGAAVLATKAVIDFGKASILAAEDIATSEARIGQINASMGLFGTETDAVTARLIEYANANEQLLATDENVIMATQAKLLTFKELAASADVAGGAFDRATAASIDLAAAGFGTAEANAVQLGKALNDPIQGISALTRVGLTFTDAEKEKIRALQESGNLLGAQEMILSAIETQVGGTAAATANASERMNLAFGEIQEQVGAALMPAFATLAETMVPIIEELAPALGEAVGALTPVLTKIAEALPDVIEAFLPLIPVFIDIIELVLDLALELMPVLVEIMNQLIPVIAELLPIFVQLLKDLFIPLIPVVLDLIKQFTPLIQQILPVLVDLALKLIPPLVTILQAIFIPLIPIIIKIIDAFLPLLEKVLPILIDLIENFVIPTFLFLADLFSVIVVGAIDFLSGALDGLMPVIETVAAFFESVWTGVSNFFKGLVNGLIGMFEGFINFIIEGLNFMIRAINKISFTVPDFVPGIGGSTIGFNLSEIGKINIPRLAEGGYVDEATLALVGEAGPEVVTPLREFERMTGLGDADGKTLNYYAAPNESIDSEAALFEAMRRARVVAQW